MDYRIILPTLVLGATLALAGAGCTGATPTTKTPAQTAPVAQQAVPAPVVAPTPVAAVTPACTKAGTVTYVNTDDTNAKWNISLNGKVVSTLDHGGESAVYPWADVAGATYLAFDPTGLGGYIPLANGHEWIVKVDHCTGKVTKFTSPIGGMNLVALSGDGETLITVGQFEGTKGTTTHVYVWSTADALNDPNAAPMHDYVLKDEWAMIGQFTFINEGDQIAFAAGDGPDDEHGAIYTLDLASGTFAKVKESATGLLDVSGWYHADSK